jgi:integrase
VRVHVNGKHVSLSQLYTAEQAAERLEVPASWLAREARAERIPHVRLGQYMGHRDIQTTQIYADYAPSANEVAQVNTAFQLDDTYGQADVRRGTVSA